MSKKDKCKELMLKYFGPASARMVDGLGEDECVAVCRKKLSVMVGEEVAKELDNA